jgi:hypothetical protein
VLPGKCVGPNLPCEIEKRYSLSPVPWDANFDFSTIIQGQSSCDPTFFFDIRKSADDFRNMLNSERSRWNHADDKAFFLGSNVSRHTFYDGDGDKNGYHEFVGTDFFPGATSVPTDWEDNLPEIRWHPTEDAIIYARQRYNTAGTTVLGGELVKRSVTFPNGSSVTLGTPVVLFYFAGYTISSSDDGYKIAGGDGNDVNGGRLLLSLVDLNNTSANDQYAVYDFDENGVDGLVKPTITTPTSTTGSYSEVLVDENSFSPTNGLFTLYADDTYFDYATVSASGLFVVARYTDDPVTASATNGVTLFDLSGNPVKRNVPGLGLVNRLHRNATGHLDVGFFRTLSDGIKECVVIKVTGGTMNNSGDGLENDYLDDGTNAGTTTPSITVKEGDIIAIYWDIEVSGGIVRHTAQARKVLDWHPNGQANESGDQYSLSSLIQTNQSSIFGSLSGLGSYPFRGLLSLKPVDLGALATPLYRYYGEIVELSLDESDPVPRRILHHRITKEGTGQSQFQPEAWFSRKGEKFFFKSHHGLSGSDQDLYFVEIPLRTCIGVREPSQLRQPSMREPSASFFPNPMNAGKSFVLLVEDNMPELSSATIRLTSLDGRVIQVWAGPVEPGSRIQAVLPNLAAGIYVAELVHAESGAQLMQQKVLVR